MREVYRSWKRTTTQTWVARNAVAQHVTAQCTSAPERTILIKTMLIEFVKVHLITAVPWRASQREFEFVFAMKNKNSNDE